MKPTFKNRFIAPRKDIASLQFSPNNTMLLASSRSLGILSYRINNSNRPLIYQCKNFTPTCSVYSNDREKIYASSTDGKVSIWNLNQTESNFHKKCHSGRINSIDILKTSGHILTASNDKTVKLWNANDLNFINTFHASNFQITTCKSNPVNSTFAAGDDNGLITIWDINSPKESLWSKSFKINKRVSILSIDYDHTGTLMCVATSDDHLSVWDIRSPEKQVIQVHNAKACCARFHPNKPMILTTGFDPMSHIFDLELCQMLYTLEGHEANTCSCAWSPNGESFATAGDDGNIILWKMPKKRIVAKTFTRRGEEEEHE